MSISIIITLLSYLLFSSMGIILVRMDAGKVAFIIQSGVLGIRIGLLTLLGGASYIISFLLWIYMLQNNNASYIMPFANGLMMCVTILMARLILKEVILPHQWIGITVIIVGILIINIRK